MHLLQMMYVVSGICQYNTKSFKTHSYFHLVIPVFSMSLKFAYQL